MSLQARPLPRTHHEGARLLVFNLPSDLQDTNLRTSAGFTHLHHMENEAVFGQPVNYSDSNINTTPTRLPWVPRYLSISI